MIKKVICTVFMLMIVIPAYAQRLGDLPSSYSPAKSSFSLLDPNRFHMSHSYSLSYISSRAGSRTLGMYLNSIEYQVSDPLRIKIDIAYLHKPGRLFNSGSGSSGSGQILPAISINWKPAKCVFFQFNYRQTPVLFGDDNYQYERPYTK